MYRLLKIGADPQGRLHKPTQALTGSEALGDVIEYMRRIMHEEGGFGISAVQVDYPFNLFGMEIQKSRVKRGWGPYPDVVERDFKVVINPTITESAVLVRRIEGCLSIPGGYRAIVTRAETVRIRYQSPDGAWHEELWREWDGWLAQHECDHGNGVNMLDLLDDNVIIEQQLTNAEWLRLLSNPNAPNRLIAPHVHVPEGLVL